VRVGPPVPFRPYIPGVDRRILLVDADAFFVGVARLVDPEGAGRAARLIVGGRPGGRGVVCSASYEARATGVRSAMPIARALRLCPDALCVPVPAACRDYSRAIHAELSRWTPLVEAASIDEWYLDPTGTERLYADAPLADVAARIRAAVQAATGLTVSVGGGPNKLVAKLAVELAKPSRSGSGVHVVEAGEVQRFLDALPLGAIPGVGPRAQAGLSAAGLRSIAEARAAHPATLERVLGARGSAWLQARMVGEDDRPVAPRAARKQVSHERTFSRDLTEDLPLERRLRALAARVGADLRAAGLRARTVTVKLRDARFRTRSMAHTLPGAVESDAALQRHAVALFHALRARVPGPLRLLGVAASSLSDREAAEGPAQLGLFGAAAPSAESERDRRLSQALDRVRARFGDEAVSLGAPEEPPVSNGEPHR
jgi:DNA polymerase IV